MRVVYVRRMDGHYFAVETSPLCPQDGSAANVADAVLDALPQVTGEVTLSALRAAGLPADACQEALVVEAADGASMPEVLYPPPTGMATTNRV
ncbi:MAG: hypothetical protein QOJ79_2684 [Actinomycetota bacterium]|jgi:hypothetical protein|nr:hypothetical protein [Actinomycetota bacterium]